MLVFGVEYEVLVKTEAEQSVLSVRRATRPGTEQKLLGRTPYLWAGASCINALMRVSPVLPWDLA